MDQLLHYLKNHTSKSIGKIAQAFVERYVLRFGANLQEPISSLANLPLNNFEVLIPLISSEKQLMEFLDWLNPMKVLQAGIPELTAHVVRKHLNPPHLHYLLDHFVSLHVCLNDKELQNRLEKEALNALLNEGKGSIASVEYATTEVELRQSVALLSEARTPVKEAILRSVIVNLKKLSKANPSLQWGEEFSCQFEHIIKSFPRFAHVATRILTQNFMRILIKQSDLFSVKTRITLLLNVANDYHTDKGASAFQQLQDVIKEAPTLDLDILENIAVLSFCYPQPPNSIILERLCKAPPEHLLGEHRLRYEMLAYLGFFLMKTEETWNAKPSLYYLLTGICNTAFKLGSVDLSKPPYCHVFGRALAVNARINPDSLNHYLDSMIEIIRRHHQISDFTELYRQFLPQLMNQWFFTVKEGDFNHLIEALQVLCMGKALLHFPKDLSGRDRLLESFIKHVVLHRFYIGTQDQQKAIILSIMGLANLEKRFYYALFLINLPSDTVLMKTHQTILSKTVILRLTTDVIEKGFTRKDITGVNFILNAFERAVNFDVMNIQERKSLLSRLVNHLKTIMPNETQYAKDKLEKFIDGLPKHVSKQERRDMHNFLISLIDS